MVRLDQGRVGELEPLIAQAAADNPGLPVVRALLGLSYAELERREDAQRVFAIDAANGFSEIPYDLAWATSLSALSHVCAYLEDTEGAALLFEKLRPSTGLIGHSVVFTLGAVDRYLGVLATTLGRFDEAESYFVAATDVTNGPGPGCGWPGPSWTTLLCSPAGTDRAMPRRRAV
jgi:hypothetical protein